MLGGTWVSRLTTIGLVLVLIPVVMTAIVGWHWFYAATYAANWNTADTTDGHAIIKSILLCLWAFVGVESVSYTHLRPAGIQRLYPFSVNKQY